MSLIRGANVVVAEYNSTLDAYVVYGCARECSLSLTTEFIETTVSGTGKFKTFLPAAMGFVGSIGGLVKLDNTNMLSLPDLQQKQINQDLLTIRFESTDEDGNKFVRQGDFYIASSEDSGPHDGINTFSVEIQGSGPLSISFTPTEILSNVKRFEYTGAGGETSFTKAELIGKTVLGFEKDGVGFSKMITSGTPADKEFKFISGTGQITVAMPFEPGEEAFGYYR